MKSYSSSKRKICSIIPHAFDFETDGLGGKALCFSWSSSDNQKGSIVVGDEDYLFEQLLKVFKTKPYKYSYKKNCGEKNIWYAHSAQYDMRYILNRVKDIEKLGYKIEPRLRSEKDIYELIIDYPEETIKLLRGRPRKENYRVVIRDSLAIFPQTLEKFSSQFSSVKKGFIDFSNVKFDVKNKDHLDYCIKDSVALRESLENYIKVVEKDYGVEMGATSSGTAMNSWQKTLADGEKYFRSEKHLESFFFKNYYGGFVFLSSINKFEDCKTFDINSSYPSVMRSEGVPGGKPFMTNIYYSSKKMPGFYEVIVETPKDLIFPVIATKEINGFTSFPRGVFKTHCSNLEIDFALSVGYKIKEVICGVVFPKTIFPFTRFVDMSEKIRKDNKNTPRETVAKIMQNGLYGRFGTKPERLKLYITSEPKEGYIPLTDDDDNVVWSRREKDLNMLTKPEWAAWITACARIKLLKTIYSVGPDKVLYCDTDSITVKSNADLKKIPVSDSYGDFKLEKEWKFFRALAPKSYAGLIGEVWCGKSKGLPKKEMKPYDFKSLYETGEIEVEYSSLQSTFVALKNGFEKSKVLKRKSSNILNSTNLEVDDYGNVRSKVYIYKEIFENDSNENQTFEKNQRFFEYERILKCA